MRKRIALMICPLLLAVPSFAQQEQPPLPQQVDQWHLQHYPFDDPNLPTEQRIDNLLSLMTTDEKIDCLGGQSSPIWAEKISVMPVPEEAREGFGLRGMKKRVEPGELYGLPQSRTHRQPRPARSISLDQSGVFHRNRGQRLWYVAGLSEDR